MRLDSKRQLNSLYLKENRLRRRNATLSCFSITQTCELTLRRTLGILAAWAPTLKLKKLSQVYRRDCGTICTFSLDRTAKRMPEYHPVIGRFLLQK